MMRTIKTGRGSVFITAQQHTTQRFQKNGGWSPVLVTTVTICAACKQPAIDDEGTPLPGTFNLPGDVLGTGQSFCSEVERKHDTEKARKLAFARAVQTFSINPTDRHTLWKAIRKGHK